MNEVLATEYLNQGKVLLDSGKSECSLEYFKKAEGENPFNPDIYVGMGIAYTNMKEYGQAEASLLKALKANSEDGKVYFYLGNLNLLKGEKVKGIQYYNQSVAKGYDDFQLFYNMGIFYEEEGEVITALKNYTKAIIKAPLKGEVWLRKARIYIKEKRFHEAAQTLEEMTIECPDNLEGYHMKIRLYGEMKEYEKTLNAVLQAREIFPEESAFVLDQANIYASLNRLGEALEILETEERRAGNNLDKRDTAVERARIYVLLGNMQGTINSLKMAVIASGERIPSESDPEAVYLLLNCYINTGEYEQALASAKSLRSMEEAGHYTLAAYYFEPYCLRMLNHEKESKELYRLGIEKLRSYSLQSPQTLDAYVFRMLCLKDLKMYEKALELLDYIIKVKDNSGEYHAIRGAILNEMGREEEAKTANAKARSLGGLAALLIEENE